MNAVIRSTSLIPSLDETKRFLEALAPGETVFTFQTYDDDKSREVKRDELSSIEHGTLEQHAEKLTRLNNKEAGVFVMVNRGDGHGRKRENVKSVRAKFVDLDGAPLEPVAESSPQPHIVVESSPGRWHAYWRVKNAPLNTFKKNQIKLAKEFAGDESVKDLPRVMRLPGFYHMKNPQKPRMTKVLSINEGEALDMSQQPCAKKDTNDNQSVSKSLTEYHDGDRNNRLASAAGKLRNLGQDADEIEGALQVINLKRCVPPLDESEVKGIARSISKYPISADDNDPTEANLAEKFYKANGESWRHCNELNSWFYWDGATWKRDRITAAYDAVRLVCKASAAESPNKSTTLGKSSTIAGVERIAKALPGLATTSEQWDSHPMLLNTPAGAVDLSTGIICEPNPTLLLSKSTSVIPSDMMDCPLWLKFVDECANGDQDLLAYLQKVVGYWLTGLTNEHSLFFIYGGGGNGKSVFLNIISSILGDYSAVASPETFVENKNTRHLSELAVLKGARLVSATETDEGRRWAEARVKSITGGDPITANLMHQNPITFTPQLKLVIVGNHKPKISNPDDAMKRRIKMIPFIHKPKTIDLQLSEKLEQEAPGILRWAIEGALLWQQEGLIEPRVVQAATDDYFEEEDSIGLWIEERLVQTASGFESISDLFRDWNQWATDNNEWAGNKSRLSQALTRKGFSPHRTKGARGIRGVTLKPYRHPEFPPEVGFLD